MLNSNERLDRINRYLAQYVTQINLGNDVGLFDGAKMLELFAQEVCRISSSVAGQDVHAIFQGCNKDEQEILIRILNFVKELLIEYNI